MPCRHDGTGRDACLCTSAVVPVRAMQRSGGLAEGPTDRRTGRVVWASRAARRGRRYVRLSEPIRRFLSLLFCVISSTFYFLFFSSFPLVPLNSSHTPHYDHKISLGVARVPPNEPPRFSVIIADVVFIWVHRDLGERHVCPVGLVPASGGVGGRSAANAERRGGCCV